MVELRQTCLQLPLATETQFNLGWSHAFLGDVPLQVTSTAYSNISLFHIHLTSLLVSGVPVSLITIPSYMISGRG